MTAFLDPDPQTPVEHPTPDVPLASWHARAGALAVDLAPGFGFLTTVALLALAAPPDDWLRWVYTGVGAVTLLVMALNRLVLPNVIGWTLGRALFGIAVRRSTADGVESDVGLRRLTFWRLTLRELAHLLDSLALFVGWMWPLWDRRRRTFADLVAGTEVHRVRGPKRDMRRLVASIFLVAAVLCTAAVGLSYAQVYRQERGVDAARAQIAEHGPRIVEQIMSYDVETLSEDFARAQTLTTDGYRPQLLAHQQAVNGGLQDGDVTTNEYRAVSGAVLTNPAVTPEQASMLLAMQGQRGTIPEDLKFIAATVRVDFDKSLDGQWRVANLTVLTKPPVNRAGQ